MLPYQEKNVFIEQNAITNRQISLMYSNYEPAKLQDNRYIERTSTEIDIPTRRET